VDRRAKVELPVSGDRVQQRWPLERRRRNFGLQGRACLVSDELVPNSLRCLRDCYTWAIQKSLLIVAVKHGDESPSLWECSQGSTVQRRDLR
jgi:hypothetical protein